MSIVTVPSDMRSETHIFLRLHHTCCPAAPATAAAALGVLPRPPTCPAPGDTAPVLLVAALCGDQSDLMGQHQSIVRYDIHEWVR